MSDALKCVKCNIEVDNSLLCNPCLKKNMIGVVPMNDNNVAYQCKECNQPSLTLINEVCNTCLSNKDVINWHKPYNTGKIQPIEAIEDWKLDFRLANAVKYISRCEHEGKTKQDLEKAIWYIERYIKIELNKDVSNG